ncbi:MAG TPA: DUF433 domain-containing protein [Chloroflexota bacterium]
MSELLAFSADQVRRLTGLSERQLRYWDNTGFFSPALGETAARARFARAYSFRDLVGLRAIAEMRNTYHIPLQELRKVGATLCEPFAAPWSDLTFYIVGHSVFYQEDKDAAIKRARPGHQQVMPFELTRIVGDVRRAIDRLRQRSKEQIGHVSRHRDIAGNQPVLDGTRIPTRAIWEFHAAGYARRSIRREYPQLTAEDIDAAIAYEENSLSRAS